MPKENDEPSICPATLLLLAKLIVPPTAMRVSHPVGLRGALKSGLLTYSGVTPEMAVAAPGTTGAGAAGATGSTAGGTAGGGAGAGAGWAAATPASSVAVAQTPSAVMGASRVT